MDAKIWQFDTWRTDRDIIFNTPIIEYDLKSAGLSVAKEFDLLPKDYIKELEKMDKKDRVVSLGKYKRDNPAYSAGETAGLESARQLFIEDNDLCPSDIVAIKKDAIFVSTADITKVATTKFGKHLEFRPKSRYVGYMYIKPIEIYYREDGELDVKGMSQSTYDEYHRDYFGKFIKGIFKIVERETAAKDFILKYIRDFYDRYRLNELDMEYYRQFDSMSQYRSSTGVMWNDVGEDFPIDRTYNANVIISILMAALQI